MEGRPASARGAHNLRERPGVGPDDKIRLTVYNPQLGPESARKRWTRYHNSQRILLMSEFWHIARGIAALISINGQHLI